MFLLSSLKYIFWSDSNKKSIETQKKEYLAYAEKEAMTSPPNDVPRSLRCSIGFELISDPVITLDGKVYERKNILKQIQLQKRDPYTTKALSAADLYPFTELFQPIQTFAVRQKAYLKIKQDLMIKARAIANGDSFHEFPSLFTCEKTHIMLNEPLLCMKNGKVYETKIIEDYLREHGQIEESGERFTLDDYESFPAFGEQIKLYNFYREQHDIATSQIQSRYH